MQAAGRLHAVDFEQRRVVEQRLGIGVGDDSSSVEQDDARAKMADQIEVMGGDDLGAGESLKQGD